MFTQWQFQNLNIARLCILNEVPSQTNLYKMLFYLISDTSEIIHRISVEEFSVLTAQNNSKNVD